MPNAGELEDAVACPRAVGSDRSTVVAWTNDRACISEGFHCPCPTKSCVVMNPTSSMSLKRKEAAKKRSGVNTETTRQWFVLGL